MKDESTPRGLLLVYSDGGSNLQVRLNGKTVWLTQAQMPRGTLCGVALGRPVSSRDGRGGVAVLGVGWLAVT